MTKWASQIGYIALRTQFFFFLELTNLDLWNVDSVSLL